MINKKIKSLIASFLVSVIITSYPIFVQASVSSDRYMQGVSVGFTSMGEVTSLDFTLTDSYLLIGYNMVLKSGVNYKVEISNSKLSLYENSTLLMDTTRDIVIRPSNNGAFVKFIKEGYMRKFSGTMTFKVNGNSIRPINTLRMEDYLKGVVPFEIGESFPIEALKAQAVAARTYAIANKGGYSSIGFDLRDDIYSQVYRGYVDNATKSNLAVDQTIGNVLTYGGRPISALFSSSNGGFTERSENVWGGSNPYFVDERDTFDTAYANWNVNYSVSEIDALLKQKYPSLNIKQFNNIDILNIQKFNSGRINSLSIVYTDNNNMQQILTIGKETARTFLGLKSALYTVNFNSSDMVYSFTGSGYGHGVGLSQWGAYGRANAGQNFNAILDFYYRNTILENASITGKLVQLNTRLGGADRYSTSKLIAENTFEDKIDNVIIATGANFPDALSGAVLAKNVNAPILLVGNNPDGPDSKGALDYIKNKLKPSGKIYILGGQGIIPNNFIDRFKQLGINESNVIRLGGKDRQETAMTIASTLSIDKSSPIVIATQENFPDALSISPIAALNGWPILLASKEELGSSIESYITTNKPEKIYIVGGTGVISDNVKNRVKTLSGYGDDKVVRLGGSNRYETSKLISMSFMQNPSDVTIATGGTYPDALSGSVYAALKGGPILLVDTSNLKELESYIRFVCENNNSVNLTILGAEGAVSQGVVNYLTSITK